MKKLWMLILLAMTFVSCGGGMIKNEEVAEINLTGIGFADADRSAGDIYEVTLDFVGKAPACDKFEKTQTTADLNSISYKITGLSAGDVVKLKLTIKKNGSVIAEGVSEEKVINFGSNSLTITMKMIHDWVFTYEYEYDFINYENNLSFFAFFDKNFGEYKKYNDEELAIEDFSGTVKDFCTDNEGNVYVYMEENGSDGLEGRIYRYKPGNGNYTEKQAIYPGLPWSLYDAYESGDMYYDSKADILYVMGRVSEDDVPYYCTYKFEKPAESTGLGIVDIDKPYKRVPAITDGGAYSKMSMAVYDNTVYYAGRLENPPGTFSLIVKTGDNQKNLIENYNDSAVSHVDGISFDSDAYLPDMRIADMAVNETGVYLLLSDDSEDIRVDGIGSYSRGALIKLPLDLSSAKAIGWTNTKQLIKKESSGSNALTFYNPKTIKDGFYGPQKILAIKPKELVFADDGATVYIYGDNNALGVKQINNIVSVDLEKLSYTSVETDMEFRNNVSISGADCHYAESWN